MRSKRRIIKIDEVKCTGCGRCVPDCPEGALQIIDGKARIVSDLFCDGLGACVGQCPEGAMTVEERAAEPYDEDMVMANIVDAGPNAVTAHLRHLKDHGSAKYHGQAVAYLKKHGIPIPQMPEPECAKPKLICGCPGSAVRDLTPPDTRSLDPSLPRSPSALRNWPIQLALIPVSAPYLKNADLLISADCVGSSHPTFHNDLVNGRVLIIACPKLDDVDGYAEKLTDLFKVNSPKSVMVAHMTVPCCSGLAHIVRQAIAGSGRTIPLAEVTIDLDGRQVK